MATTTEVLEAVAQKLRQVPGLAAVYTYHPRLIPELPAAVVWENGGREYRAAIGYGGGRKWIDSHLAVQLFAQGHDPEGGLRDFYALVDAVQASLRGDSSLGGLLRRFAEEIETEIDPPQNQGDITHFRATITVHTQEEIVA